jgi:AraC family transcriptional regulator
MIQFVPLDSPMIPDSVGEPALTSSPLSLSDLVREASAALRDASATVEDRVRHAYAILEQVPRVERNTGSAPTPQKPRTLKRGGLAGWQIRRLKSFVHEKLANPISIADMALLARLSPQHFCRAFRASLNETPHNYVVRMRVERAGSIMRTTHLPLSQIAIDCGFADQAHLNKSFRKYVGHSPGAWRRRQADDSAIVEVAVYGDWRGTGAHPERMQSAHRFSNPVPARES